MSYEVKVSKPTGGKAGKGKNATSTVQVIERNHTGSFMVKKLFRFKMWDHAGKLAAINKAADFAREHNARQAVVKRFESQIPGFIQ